MSAVTAEAPKRGNRRQSVRKAVMLTSFLLFPITINYFSPYLIVEGAGLGIINGSFVAFALMFASALVFGRAWCGWACPMGGLQDVLTTANGSRTRGRRLDWIKWGIWVPWIVLIVAAATSAGGYDAVNLLYKTETGISVDRPAQYATYYTVIAVVVVLSLAVGRRAGCHSVCWMAPFMIAGRKAGNALRLPGLRLKADPAACSGCGTCTRGCPMSLEVTGMVQSGRTENSECALCGTCVDGCPKKAIAYTFATSR